MNGKSLISKLLSITNVVFALVGCGISISATAETVIKLNGDNPLTFECHTAFDDPGATAYSSPPEVPLSVIAAGEWDNLALRADGALVSWGSGIPVPAAATNVIAISVEGVQHMALRNDGQLVVWALTSEVMSVPGASAVAVAAGKTFDSFNLVLRSDGTVFAFVRNELTPGPVLAEVPDNVTNVVAIASGTFHALALKNDGTVVAWGDNTANQLNVPPDATNVIAISAGNVHSLALKSDGTIVAWGDNFWGQLDIPPEATNIIAISAGGFDNLALRADGTVVAWGTNRYGPAYVPPNATNIVEVSAGDFHSLAKTASGWVLAWGNDWYHQTDIPISINTNFLRYSVAGDLNPDVPGTYTVTYTTTNSVGDVATAPRTVSVQDTIAPEISAPTNVLAEFTSATGAQVTFIAAASDLCSGELPVTCVPISGSVFRIGTNLVTCSTTDNVGNQAQASLTVTVLGAKGVTHDVVSEIITVKSDFSTTRIPLLDAAINSLSRADSASVWSDETHINSRYGETVFTSYEATSFDLSRLALLQSDPIGATQLRNWNERLARCSRLLAQTEINDAVKSGTTTRRLSRAIQFFAKGDTSQHRREYVAAIQYYRDAWNVVYQMRVFRRFPGL